ncbi:hypothetical protein [Bacillus sp. FJAT-45350]|uniref:hypothetical protein n=1 Tax=Bacillus sp. FJAT-45350 TaxID=2011014 RepID=UPI000BB79CCB|nr:hypothetical protein [Bacillus sp. FJAT-45350]
MEYILDRVEKQEEDFVRKKSFFIQDSSVSYVNESMDKLKYLRVNAEGFILTPGHIMHDLTILEISKWDEYKKRMELLISKGCTTVITFSHVRYESQLKESIRKARHKMINSSIDFVVCVSTRAKALTPTFIRKCKREKVPMITVKLESIDELNEIQWPRLKEAMLNYQILIIPDYSSLQLKSKELRRLREQWYSLSRSYRIPTSELLPNELTPYPKRLIKRMGLFPIKGELITGSDVDYNLYSKKEFKYGKEENPEVVVIRGKIVKAGNRIYAKPGFGKEYVIQLPGHFVTIEDAYKNALFY